jgi:hypothetical protein
VIRSTPTELSCRTSSRPGRGPEERKQAKELLAMIVRKGDPSSREEQPLVIVRFV